MSRGAAPSTIVADASLSAWRSKAITVFSVVSAVAYLPAEIIMVLGQAPPHGWPAQFIVLAAYVGILYSAVFYWSNYRARAWTILVGGYLVALIHLVTIPHGPFGRALPAMLPILAFVILGTRPGMVTTVFSMGFILIVPLLQRVPGLVEILTNAPAEAPLPMNVIWEQGVALIAILAGQMILLDRFHDFLMRSLAKVQREASERTAAYRKLEHEMQERRRLENEVARVGDEERRRLGVDIHDGVCQQLTGALLRCEAMARRLERNRPLTPDEFSALSKLLEEAIDESHSVAKGLCPLDPGPEALATALHTLSKRTWKATGNPCLFTTGGDVNVADPVTAQHLYRIAQEAVSNAVRHANAPEITIRLQDDGERLVLEVEDNGEGLSPQTSGEGMGLSTMAYRAHLLGGALSVTPKPAGGTRVLCQVPNTVSQSSIRPHLRKEIP